MFCQQCEQTAGGKACTIKGVCGKDEKTAVLQDLLVHSLMGLAIYGHKLRELDVTDKEADRFIIEGLFTTVTNVNFDPNKISMLVLKSYKIKERIKELFHDAYREKYGKMFEGEIGDIADWKPGEDFDELLKQGHEAGILKDLGANEDVRSLREILLLGLKGTAAYADHALILGREDEEVTAFFHKGLASLVNDNLNINQLIELVMECGKVNLRCMELLDEAHREHFGDPVPTKVSIGWKKGPAIVVSGHDLYDLEQLLKQTEGKGVNIYTHGEMLPAHGYPKLKKYKHLVANYGGAWQDQKKEFNEFPGAILMTTNCIQEPKDTYKENIFTTGLVAWPGVKHISKEEGEKDFSPVIKKAIELGGFKENKEVKDILVGFAHNAVLGAADKVIEGVKKGKIKHFFLIGGCDGAKPGRNYYTEFAEKVPKDSIMLTLACGKYRFNKLEFGDIGGIPRLLDCGQCNDAYSAITIAKALAGAFGVGINELPLSIILSWYEQKAVCILLSLFYLGIKNIKIGPSLPAFISPNVLKVLVENFNIQPIKTADEDLKEILG